MLNTSISLQCHTCIVSYTFIHMFIIPLHQPHRTYRRLREQTDRWQHWKPTQSIHQPKETLPTKHIQQTITNWPLPSAHQKQNKIHPMAASRPIWTPDATKHPVSTEHTCLALLKSIRRGLRGAWLMCFQFHFEIGSWVFHTHWAALAISPFGCFGMLSTSIALHVRYLFLPAGRDVRSIS